MQTKLPLRELNFFYMLAFLMSGVLYGGSTLLSQTISLPKIETILITTMAAQWAPALAAIFTNLRFKNRPKPGSFRPHISLILLPLAPVLTITAQHFLLERLGSPYRESEFFTGPGLIILSVVTTIIGSVGEEIGWRGYLFPRLKRYIRPWQASLWVGLLWGVWHFTKIFTGGFGFYLTFILSTIPLGFIIAYINEKSGRSIVPGILYHTVLNLLFMYFLYERERSAGHFVILAVMTVFILLIRLIDPAYFRREAETTKI